jgi:hypothetical protein
MLNMTQNQVVAVLGGPESEEVIKKAAIQPPFSIRVVTHFASAYECNDQCRSGESDEDCSGRVADDLELSIAKLSEGRA